MPTRKLFSSGLALAGAMVALMLWPATAQAQYLDPGAGSILLQVIIAAVVGVAATLKLYWGKISGIRERRGKSGSKV
jgi:uncharacterized integral membrane protein